ncbi:metal-sensitive transcriptional regulator [Candidatus Uhrbacteria bacterium]|nr:metal-sensitive transcriptional regulator [Candidatus Uhrbacteria bacterium]
MVNQALKKRALHRAKIIQGQLEGLVKGIDAQQYCTKLLQLSLSIQRSLKSLDALLLENHLKTHVRDQMMRKESADRATQELIDIYTLSNK